MRAATTARNAFEGDDLYQRRAREALPLLVRQAIAEQTVTYGDLAAELHMPNPRNMNFVLGAAAQALVDLSAEWREAIPRLTALVVDQALGLPSDGIAEFLDDPAAYRAASPEQRRRIVDRVLFDVYAYQDWPRVLTHFGLQTAPAGGAPSAGQFGGGGPEGTDHIKLKEFVAAHPESVGVSRKAAPGRIEFCLPRATRWTYCSQSTAKTSRWR